MPTNKKPKTQLNSIAACKICCEENKLATATFSQCRHSTCTDCITQWILKIENSGQETLPGCPFCRSLLSKEDIVGILGRPYAPAEKLTSVSNLEDLDELTRQYLESRAKPCPGCGAYIEKTQGCDKMECLCGYRFCYSCGARDADCICSPPNHQFWRNANFATLQGPDPMDWEAHFPWLPRASEPTTTTTRADSMRWRMLYRNRNIRPQDFDDPYPDYNCLWNDSNNFDHRPSSREISSIDNERSGTRRHEGNTREDGSVLSNPSLLGDASSDGSETSCHEGNSREDCSLLGSASSFSDASSDASETSCHEGNSGEDCSLLSSASYFSDATSDGSESCQWSLPSASSVTTEEIGQDSLPSVVSESSLDVVMRKHPRRGNIYGCDDHDKDIFRLLFEEESSVSSIPTNVIDEDNAREGSGLSAQEIPPKRTRHRVLKIVTREVAMARARLIKYVTRIRRRPERLQG